jgi:hypothetical protein
MSHSCTVSEEFGGSGLLTQIREVHWVAFMCNLQLYSVTGCVADGLIAIHIPICSNRSSVAEMTQLLDYKREVVRFPTGAGNFSLHHRVQNGSGAHPASYPLGTRGSFPGGKAAGA